MGLASAGGLASNIDHQKATSLMLCSIEKLLRLSYGSAWLVYSHVMFGRFVVIFHHAGQCPHGRLHKVVPELLKGAIASQVFAQVRRQGTGSKGGKLGGSLSWLCSCSADWLHSFLIHKLRETSDSSTVLSILRELSEARTK